MGVEMWTAGRDRGSVSAMAETGLNATAAALLGLLHEGQMTGGQLMAASQSRLGPFWTMTRSQIYRELPGLADRGYVRAGKAGPRSSQPYAVTAAGKKAFTRWLGEPAGHDQLRNPLLLRAVFGEAAGPARLADLYDSKAEEHTTALATVKDQLKDAKKNGDRFAQAALEFAVAYHRAVLKWLESAPGR
jgi:DNA-binding PadR family transcriptional regulator